jgi:glycosyltransferase involved in cell wall biosynthesis
LKYCLDSLEKQSVDKSLYEVIVVDNNSTDNTKQVVEEYCGRNANFRYVFEKVNSSSIARNTGSKVANGLWLGFIDDDARCPQDYVEKAMIIIDQNEFDCFGGRYVAWFKVEPPKWINKNDFGTAPIMMEKKGILKTQHLSGTSIFVRKNVFEIVGGFNVDLGIKGDKRGYGEETDFVNRIRTSGSVVGYDPDLFVEHLVNPQKFKLKWHLQDIVAHSETEYLIWIRPKTGIEKIRAFKNGFLSFFKTLFNAAISIIKTDDYYWQSYIIDVFKPFLKICGYLLVITKCERR